MVKLIHRKKNINISATNLRDGQLAEIIECSHKPYIGNIVQRNNNKLIQIGLGDANQWDSIPYIQVRVLDDGDILEILNNK